MNHREFSDYTAAAVAPRSVVSKAWFRSEFEGDAYRGAERIETADSGCLTIGAIETRKSLELPDIESDFDSTRRLRLAAAIATTRL